MAMTELVYMTASGLLETSLSSVGQGNDESKGKGDKMLGRFER